MRILWYVILVQCCVGQQQPEIVETDLPVQQISIKDVLSMGVFVSGVIVAALELIVYGLSYRKEVTIGFAEFSDNSRSEKSQPPATGTIHFDTQPHQVIVSRILGEFTDPNPNSHQPNPSYRPDSPSDGLQHAQQPSNIALRDSSLHEQH